MSRFARRWSAACGGAIATCLALTLVMPATAHASGGILTIGDSVMLGARSELRRHDITVDAAESRFPRAGVAVIRAKGNADDVVIHLGTNGQLVERDCRRLVEAASRAQRVHLMTIKAPRDYARRNNVVIRSCAAAFPADRVFVIDWAKAASAHPAWLYSDGIHLRPAGAKGFARLVLDSVERARSEAFDPGA